MPCGRSAGTGLLTAEGKVPCSELSGDELPPTHPVQAPLQEAQQDTDRVHVDTHVLERARPDLGGQQDVQTLQGQVAQQVHGVAERVEEERREHTMSGVFVHSSLAMQE